MLRYKNNTLSTVIFRVDFVKFINIENESLNKKCLSKYPIVQNENVVEQSISTVINEKGEMTVERNENNKKYVNRRYSNRQMTRRVTLSPKCIIIELQDYISYVDTKAAFMEIFTAVSEANSDVAIARIGMRYINQIDLSNIAKSTRAKYIKASLLSSPYEDVLDDSSLARTQHLTEIAVDDFRVRCVTGYFNPDYPAPIKRYVVTLDYDAFIQGNADASEVSGYLDKFHDAIQMLFENSILQKQKESMVVVDAE